MYKTWICKPALIWSQNDYEKTDYDLLQGVQQNTSFFVFGIFSASSGSRTKVKDVLQQPYLCKVTKQTLDLFLGTYHFYIQLYSDMGAF